MEKFDEEGNYIEFLPYAYRLYAQESSADNAYAVATTLRNLFLDEKAIPWYEKTLELDPTDWETACFLAYLYSQWERFEDAIALAKQLLTFDKAEESDFRDEVYCMLADANYFNGDIEEAVAWQDSILRESKNKELIIHTKRVQKQWKSEQ